jgi:hypothetical protein
LEHKVCNGAVYTGSTKSFFFFLYSRQLFLKYLKTNIRLRRLRLYEVSPVLLPFSGALEAILQSQIPFHIEGNSERQHQWLMTYA